MSQERMKMKRKENETKFLASFEILSPNCYSHAYGSSKVYFIALHKSENDTNAIPEKLNLCICSDEQNSANLKKNPKQTEASLLINETAAPWPGFALYKLVYSRCFSTQQQQQKTILILAPHKVCSPVTGADRGNSCPLL